MYFVKFVKSKKIIIIISMIDITNVEIIEAMKEITSNFYVSI